MPGFFLLSSYALKSMDGYPRALMVVGFEESMVRLKTEETGVAASVAPEDLRCGDSVAILSMVYEYPSFFWCPDSVTGSREEPVRVRYCGVDGGVPLKIQAICLPFVFIKEPAGSHRSLDTRLCRLVRLSPEYVRRVWKAMRKKRGEVSGIRS